MAKILAKAVNCQMPVDNEPCGLCPSCTSIAQGINLNAIEIDAASNNGVDNIRDLREEVKYPPTDAKFKVYIIDEVHMLSTGAFNALLKTLEEPPPHVIFILATTDPQKIPATIHSRCQRFDFKRVSKTLMVEKLSEYSSNEGVDIDEAALGYIASLADGSVRDALSLLDQCMSFYFDEKITAEKVLEITGSVNTDVFYKLAGALCACDSGAVLELIDEAVTSGRDINQMVQEFIVHLRNLLVAKSLDTKSRALDFSEDSTAVLKEQAEKFDGDLIISYIYEFSKLQNKLKHSTNDRILFETSCIKLCNPSIRGDFEREDSESTENNTGFSDIERRLDSLELKIEQKIKGQSQAYCEEPREQKPVIKPEKKPAAPENEKSLMEKWDDFAGKIGKGEFVFIKKTKLKYEAGTLYIVCENPVVLSALKNKAETIKEKLKKSENLDFEFKMLTKTEFEGLYGSESDGTEASSKEGFDELRKKMGI